MPKITKIEVQKKNKERFNLYLDEEFEMGIDMDTYVHFNLKKVKSLMLLTWKKSKSMTNIDKQ